MKIQSPMPLLRLAYSTLYLIALVSFYYVWSEVGGQSHLDLLPWWIKLGLGLATAFTVVRAAASAVGSERPFNGQTLKWLSATVVLGVIAGMATYYAHMYLEETDEGDSTTDSAISRLASPRTSPGSSTVAAAPVPRRCLAQRPLRASALRYTGHSLCPPVAALRRYTRSYSRS